MRLLTFVLIVQLLFLGCAKIEVHRALPSENEREGIPFYLQRPYVVVQKSFPVEGDEGYLFGTVDPNAGTITFRNMSGELSKRLGIERTMPLSSLRRPAVAPGTPLSAPEETTAPPPEKTSRKETTEKVATDASGFAKWDASVPDSVEINEFFKVVYLPDLDEKYVISPSAGIGTAKLSVAMGPGGTINQFQVNLDNQEIGKLVMDTARTAVSLAEQAAKLQIGTLFASREDFGRAVTAIVVKYIYIGYAMPGVYPILKNSEYAKTVFPMATDPYLLPAEWPYTRFSLKVKRELVLVAQDLSPQPSRPDGQEEAPTPVQSAIAGIEAKLKKMEPVPIKQLEDVNATFDKIVENESRKDVVFAIPRTAHEKYTHLSKDEQQTIQNTLFAAVQKQIGDKDTQFLLDNKYKVALRPE